MATMVESGPDTAPVEAYVAAVVAQDRDAIAAVFGDAAEVRALVPRGFREADGPDAAATLIYGWFGDAELTELTREVEAIGDRIHLRYRFRAVEDGRTSVVEQHGFADVADGRIVKLQLLCSGFRPVDASPA
jgi:limonene-1,2-epoxide hydrolase